MAKERFFLKVLEKDIESKIFTIPNVLSLVRILMVPFIIFFYSVRHRYVIAGCLLIASGITDLIDGFISRRYNQISNLGKILDPFADKLTQLSMMLCLILRFPLIAIPCGLLVIKEAFAVITGLLRIKKSKSVHGALWHGKVTTVFLYVMMILHVFWGDIPSTVSNVLIFVCTGFIVLSGILYVITNLTAAKKAGGKQAQSESE